MHKQAALTQTSHSEMSNPSLNNATSESLADLLESVPSTLSTWGLLLKMLQDKDLSSEYLLTIFGLYDTARERGDTAHTLQLVGTAIAKHPNTPPETLVMLMDTTDERVRQTAINHPSFPPHMKIVMQI